MKQYTTPEQTAKLIELGLLPKHIQSVSDDGKMLLELMGFSIGELIEMLPKVISHDKCDTVADYVTLEIFFDCYNWVVYYQDFLGVRFGSGEIELVDALYDMVVKLKEEGVI